MKKWINEQIINCEKFAFSNFVGCWLLLSLLGLFGFLQYKWFSQISEAEKERLEKRLKTDSEKFAQDFNKEISDIRMILRMNKENVADKDWSEFNEGFNNWLSKPNIQSS